MHLSRRSIVTGAALVGGAGASIAAAAARSLFDTLPDDEQAAIAAGTSEFDCGPVLRAAMAKGGAVFLPAGRYVVKTPAALMATPTQGRFASGIVLLGEGVGRTIIDDRTTGRALFDFDSGADPDTGFRAIRDVHLSGLTIEGSGAAAHTAAIRLRGCFQSSLSDLHVTNRLGEGVVIPCQFGDIDGSNMIDLERVRIENCGGWGVDAAAMPGHNEISYLHLRHVVIQNCGTRGRDAIPTSGGMRYKGQVLDLDQCAFTLNQNVGLLIPGAAGLAINVQLASTSFENNLGRHLLCTGVSVFRGVNLQFFSSEGHVLETACEFAGDTHTVRAVTIDGVTVRVSARNGPCTGFRLRGANLLADSCEVRRVVWEEFGRPGQVQFDRAEPRPADR